MIFLTFFLPTAVSSASMVASAVDSDPSVSGGKTTSFDAAMVDAISSGMVCTSAMLMRLGRELPKTNTKGCYVATMRMLRHLDSHLGLE